MKIIPAIDIRDGKCVRLTQGDYNQEKIYNSNPIAVAKEFEANGIQDLHVVDLDGARSGGIVNQDLLKRITSETNLNVDFGGGMKSEEDLDKAFEAGVKQVTISSLAVTNRPLVLKLLKKYGANRIILGADSRNRKLAINGWTEESEMDILDFIRDYVEKGVQTVIATDISKDGMMTGPAFELYQEILTSFPAINLIASGGVSSLEDLEKLEQLGCAGTILGKAIYEEKIKLSELSNLC